jgi:hypothetical protein
MIGTKNIDLNESTIEAYERLVCNPSVYQLKFRSIKECFVESNEVTAKHILAGEYIRNETPLLPKLICYIIMDNIFGQCDGKDANGNLGYHLKYVPR